MRTIAARILAACLLAGLSGCALLFNFGDYGRDGGAAGGGSGIGGNGSSSGSNGSNGSSGSGSGQSSGSLPSTSSGMCGGQSSTGSGAGGSGSTQISGPADDDVLAMDVDSSGNIVIAGAFRGSVNVGGVSYDLKSNAKRGLFLAEFDPTGVKLWSKLLATSADPLALTAGVAIDPADDSVIIAGGYGSTVDFGFGPKGSDGGLDVFAAKYDKNGSIIWSHTFGGAGNESANAVAVDSTGQVVITGAFDQDILPDNANCPPISGVPTGDAFITKVDSGSGVCSWLKRTNSTQGARADGAVIDKNDNIYVSGAFQGVLKPGGVPDVTATAAQGDTFLVKYGPGGGPLFANHLAPAGKALLAIDPMLGSLVVSGSAVGSPYGVSMQPYGGGMSDMLAGMYTQAGVVSFAKLFGGPGDESAHVVALPDGSGKLVMGGVFQGLFPFGGASPPCAVGSDAFVVLLDNAGSPMTTRAFGGDMDQAIRFVRAPAASQGKIVVAGVFQGTIDIGQGPLSSGGGYDIFVGTIPFP